MPEKTFLINSQYGHSLSSDGSTFSMNLQPPLVLPKDSEPTISVLEATAWHTAENIKTGVNDVFKASFANVSSNAVQTMTFPPGIYNLTSLNLRLSHFLIDLGLDSQTLRFVGVQATSSLLLHATPDAASGNITVNFTDATMTMRSFLGFENNPSVTFTQKVAQQPITLLSSIQSSIMCLSAATDLILVVLIRKMGTVTQRQLL